MMRTAGDGESFDRSAIDSGDPLVGALLDQRFRIDHQLAAGGFGAIYRATDMRATDMQSEAAVALKVLLPKLAGDPMVVARFRREGKTLASLRDPHTITAYELGEAPDGTLYIVMELLHGESLYTRLHAGGPLPWRRALHIATGVCSSLAEAHALGVVHRDLKPANIHLELVDGDPDFVKVLDFGIAKIVQGLATEHTQLTQAGQMIGTVDYMSPEQMVGGELTPASDIYALGVVMYEAIAGRTPFADAQSATAILAAVLTRTAEPLSNHARVPAALDPIVARCLERDARHRYGDVGEVAEALAEVAAESIARPRPAALRVPTSSFEPELTTEATRIDVRFTGSSEPVLDARGPRRPASVDEATVPARAAAVAPPAPPARPARMTPTPPARAMPRPPVVGGTPSPKAVGSDHAIDWRGMRAPRPTPTPPPPAHPAPPRAPVAPAAMLTPIPSPPPPLPVSPFGTLQPPPPRTGPEPPSFDMIAAASYDKLVRRIIWAAVIIAIAAFIVIATR